MTNAEWTQTVPASSSITLECPDSSALLVEKAALGTVSETGGDCVLEMDMGSLGSDGNIHKVKQEVCTLTPKTQEEFQLGLVFTPVNDVKFINHGTTDIVLTGQTTALDGFEEEEEEEEGSEDEVPDLEEIRSRYKVLAGSVTA